MMELHPLAKEPPPGILPKAGKILFIPSPASGPTGPGPFGKRVGVRVDMTSDGSPSLPPCGIPYSLDLCKAERDLSSPLGERKETYFPGKRRGERDVGIRGLNGEMERFVLEEKRIPAPGGIIL
jgi:hypothetical protein